MKRLAIVASITAIVMAGGTAAYSAGSINGDNIQSNTIDSGEIQNNTLTTTDIKDGTLSGADVADASLTGSDIKDGSLGSNDLVTGAVGSVQIKDGSITGADIRQDTLTYIEDQANLRRGGKTGVVAYASSDHSDLQPVRFLDGNGVVYDGGEGGDFLAVMTATFTTTVPIKVSVTSSGGHEVGFCIADPAGFGVASCNLTMLVSPAVPPSFQALTADGGETGAMHPAVTFALVKVG